MEETLSLIAVAIIVAAAIGFSLWPLFQTSGDSTEVAYFDSQKERASEEIARLFAEREQAYKNILEIELDHEMGKLSEEDYADMIGQTRADAVEILRRLESRGVKEGMAPAHVSVDEMSEAAARAADSTHAHEGSSVDGDSGPLRAGLSASANVIDERLEEEILQYRKVEAPMVQADRESENTPPKRFCPACGAETDAGHNFCAACGEKLN